MSININSENKYKRTLKKKTPKNKTKNRVFKIDRKKYMLF